MEYGRFSQVTGLKEKGWTYYERLQEEREVCGSPSLMVNPTDKKVYNVSCGREWPLEGNYVDIDGKNVVFADGVIVGKQG